MKKSLRTILCLVLAISLLGVMLAGCGKAKEEEPKETPAATEQKTETETAKAEEPAETAADNKGEFKYSTEPVEFEAYMNYSWWKAEYPWDDNNKIAKYIKDTFGISIKWNSPGGNEDEKMNLMIATDNLPEVVIMDRNDMWKKLIELKKLVPIDDYLKKYPGISSAIPDSLMNMERIDGKMYGILNWIKTPEYLGGNGGYMINKQIYEQLGSPKLQTLDDLYAYCKKVKESNIKVDGKSVIPLQLKRGDSLDGIFPLWTAYGEKRHNQEISPRTNKTRPQGSELKLTLNDAKFEEYMLYLNKLYTEGLINKDYFVETQEQVDEKLAQGRVAVYASPDMTVQGKSAMQALKDAGAPYEYEVIEPIAAAGVDQKDIYTSTGSRLGWNIICITNKAKDPERIYQYFDWAITPEGHRVLGFGPKGVLWNEVDENGFPILPDDLDYTKRSNELPLGKFLLPGMTQWYDTCKFTIDQKRGKGTWESNAQNKVTFHHTYDDTEYTSVNPPAGTEEADIDSDAAKYLTDQYTKMITAKSADEVKKFIEETKAELYRRGFEKVEKYMTQKWIENKQKLGIN